MRKAILLCKLLLLQGVLFAQHTGSVKGKVTDEQTAEVLPGASITIKGSSLIAYADLQGTFSFSALSAGSHVLLISHVSYETIELPITVQEGKSLQVNASLAMQSYEGSEVVVSASRRPEKITYAPAPIQVINAKDISRFAGSNVGELVSRVQGVEYTRSGVDEITFNARGLNSAFNIRVFQLVDGRNSMAAASGSLPMFNNGSTQKDDIERIEIVLGPQTALYGPNAHNALFNYITKDPRKHSGTTVSVSAGSQYQFSSRFRHASVINQKWAYKLTGEHATGKDYQWYDTVYVGPTGQLPIPERIQDFTFRRMRGEGHVYYAILPKGDLILSGGGSRFTRLQVTTGGRNALRDITYSFLQARFVLPRFLATIYNTWGNMGKSLNMANYTRDYWTRTRPGPGYEGPEAAETFASRLGNRFKEQSQRLNAEAQYNHSFSEMDLHLVAGASYQVEKPNGYGINLVDSFERIQVTQYGVVLQAEKRLPWHLRFVGATRFDHHSNFGSFIAPRLALVRHLKEGSIRITWGKAYSMPSILNQYSGINRFLFGNGGSGIQYIPDGSTLNEPESFENTTPLKPEQVITWELGYRGKPMEKLFVDLNFYNGVNKQFISPAITVAGRALSVNEIPVTHNPFFAGKPNANGKLQNATFLTFLNYGDVRIWGADVGVQYRFSKYFDAAVKYSWLDSDITEINQKNDANGDKFVTRDETTLNAPKHRALVMLNGQNLGNEKLFFSITARWMQQYDFYSGNQIGTAAGKGKRGFVEIPGKPQLPKNFDWGPLGGFTTVDLQMGYQVNPMYHINLGVTNLLNSEQIEMAGSPSIGRLVMAELKIHLPGKAKETRKKEAIKED